MSTALQLCQAAEEHLASGDPERLNQALETLQRVAIMPRSGRDPQLVAGLRRVRKAARQFRATADFKMNLYLGWMQLGGGAGYTSNGTPVPIPASPKVNWEI
jgi:hypothetical protein